MMIAIVIRRVVVVVLLGHGLLLQNASGGHALMLERDMPGGKKPSEKSQHSEDSKERTHGRYCRREHCWLST